MYFQYKNTELLFVQYLYTDTLNVGQKILYTYSCHSPFFSFKVPYSVATNTTFYEYERALQKQKNVIYYLRRTR
jgi:hypothetical protein